MNPDDLTASLLAVVTPIAEQRRPGEPLGMTASDITLERPRNRDHGDWATNIAMKLAKRLGANPRELATEIAEGLGETAGIASVEVAGPGLHQHPARGGGRRPAREADRRRRCRVRHERHAAGRLDQPRVRLSATRRDPCTSGTPGGRPSATRIGRMLAASGATIVREFYINDAGAQMERFGGSVLVAAPRGADPGGRLPAASTSRRSPSASPRRARRSSRPRGPGARWSACRRGPTSFSSARSASRSTKFNVHFDV